MLDAIPHGIFSWDFTVWRNGEAIADIDMSWFREHADVQIGGQTFSVYRESMLKGAFALQAGDRILARAWKVSVFARAFEIDFEGRKFELKATSYWTHHFALSENGIQIGWIGPTSWLGRKSVIDLPEDLPLPVQVFLFWLVVVLWRRRAASSSS
jgi:hypothetical protein